MAGQGYMRLLTSGIESYNWDESILESVKI